MTKIQSIIAGMMIFQRYSSNASVNANHDEILVQCDQDTISAQDKKILDGLGWFWSTGYECYQIFV